MINPILGKKYLNKDILNIYIHGFYRNHPTIRNWIQDSVRSCRRNVRATGHDLLAEKAASFAEPGSWAKHKARELSRDLFSSNGKTPPLEDVGNWRSIELEVVFISQDHLDLFVNEVKASPFRKRTTIKTDSSIEIETFGNIPREIVLSYKKGNEHEVTALCNMLKGKAYVNSSCGFHVHFDMRHKTEPEFKVIANRLARMVPALREMLPFSRRTNKYCYEPISRGKGSGHRRAFVNTTAFDKYSTLEVRGHSGTINPTKILNWIEICDIIMNKRIRLAEETVTTVNRLLNIYPFREELRNYMLERVMRMVGETKEEPAYGHAA